MKAHYAFQCVLAARAGLSVHALASRGQRSFRATVYPRERHATVQCRLTQWIVAEVH